MKKNLNDVACLVRALSSSGIPLPADVNRTLCGGGVPEGHTHPPNTSKRTFKIEENDN